MPSRYDIPETENSQKRSPAGKYPAVDVLDSNEHASRALNDATPTYTPERTLSPVSASAMNTLKLVTNPEQRLGTTNGNTENRNGQKGRNNSQEVAMSSRQPEKIENIPSSNDRSYGLLSTHSHPLPRSPISVSPLVRTISSEFGPTRMQPSLPRSEENVPPNGDSSPQWSSAVGKANLGKSGRVIEQLMSQNDHLKRDLQLTKLQAEESRNEAKMVQGRMESMQTDYEDMAHQVTVLETILKRKERQLGEYKDQIDGERRKAQAAMESERNWREEMEKMSRESKHQVDEAKNYAVLTEGRYNTLASHWKEQGELVDASTQKITADVSIVLDERRKDYAKMDKLEQMCEQKDRELQRQLSVNQAQHTIHESYKAAQETELADIKSMAKEQDRLHKLKTADMQRTLGEMRWVMAVKENVKGAR